MDKLKKPLILFLLFAMLAMFVMGALAPVKTPASTSAQPSKPVQPANLEVTSSTAYALVAESATGVSVGAPSAEKTVYVVFDPKCPHCGHLWMTTKELHEAYRFVWIPVAFLARASLVEGAALLEGGAPVIDAHETAVAAGTTSTLKRPSQEFIDKVANNTAVIGRIQVEGVPILFHKTPDGQIKVASGGLSAAEVKTRLAL